MNRFKRAALLAAIIGIGASTLVAVPAAATVWTYHAYYGYADCGSSKLPTLYSFAYARVIHQIEDDGGYVGMEWNNGTVKTSRTFTRANPGYAAWGTIGYTDNRTLTNWFCKA